MAKRGEQENGAAVMDDPADLAVDVPALVPVEEPTKTYTYFAFGEPNVSVQYAIEATLSDGKKTSEAHEYASGGVPYAAIDASTKRGAAQIAALRLKQRKGGRVLEIKKAPPENMLAAFASELSERVKDANGDDINALGKSATRIKKAVFDRWIRKFGFK